MAPFYRGYQPVVTLHTDDVEGIQALYGEKESIVKSVNDLPKTVVRDNDVDNRELCRNTRLDTIVSFKTGETFVFQV